MPLQAGPLLTAAALSLAFALFAALCQGAEGAFYRLGAERIDALAESKPSFQRAQLLGERLITRWSVLRGAALVLGSFFLVRGLPLAWSVELRVVAAVAGTLLWFRLATELSSAFARRRPEQTLTVAMRVLLVFEWLTAPLSVPLSALGRVITRWIPEPPADNPEVASSVLDRALSEGERTGALQEESAEMIRNVLEFGDRVVHNVMVPRTKITAFDIATPIEEVRRVVADDAHSRYPVFRDTIDQVIGLLYTKDLFSQAHAAGIDELLRRKVILVTESQPVLSVLREMRARRQHMAVVTDTYGGTAGLITMEDILEEIVGDIDDEHDENSPMVQRIGEDRFVADATISLADLEDYLGKKLPAEGDFESLGGLIVNEAGRVPQVGASISVLGFRFIVRDADEVRVRRVEILHDPGHGALLS